MSSLPRECAKLRERLPELAEGVLGGRDRAHLEGHLASCPRCAAELADLRVIVSALRAISPDPLPAHVLGSVRREVAARARPIARPPVQHWARLVLASSAAAVVLAMALTFYFTQGGEKGVHSMFAKQAGQRGLGLQGKPPGESGPVSLAELPAATAVAPRLPAPQASERSLPRTGKPQAGKRSGGDRVSRTETPPQPVLEAAFSDRAGPQGPPGVGAGGGGARRGGAGRPCRQSPGANQSKVRHDKLERAGAATGAFRVGAVGPEARLRASGEAAAAKPTPALARARLGMVNATHQLTITLAPGAAAEDASLVMQQPDGHPVLLWRGRLTETVTVPIPAGSLGSGPASIPLVLESQLGRRQYLLFLPVLSRLGQTAPSLPAMRYNGEPLGSVLGQLSALSGLVLLVEGPLDQPVSGELPAEDPSAALTRLAAEAGFAMDSEGEILRTLTRTKGD